MKTDAEFINGDVKMLVDSLSYQYLVGSVVDTKGLEGSRSLIANPNANKRLWL
jgi:iron-sulfur cluster insertion protein